MNHKYNFIPTSICDGSEKFESSMQIAKTFYQIL